MFTLKSSSADHGSRGIEYSWSLSVMGVTLDGVERSWGSEPWLVFEAATKRALESGWALVLQGVDSPDKISQRVRGDFTLTGDAFPVDRLDGRLVVPARYEWRYDGPEGLHRATPEYDRVRSIVRHGNGVAVTVDASSRLGTMGLRTLGYDEENLALVKEFGEVTRTRQYQAMYWLENYPDAARRVVERAEEARLAWYRIDTGRAHDHRIVRAAPIQAALENYLES